MFNLTPFKFVMLFTLVRVFIFDDYGLPPGEVKKAIDDKLLSGELRDIKFIGEKPSDLVSASGTKFFDMEGCICNA